MSRIRLSVVFLALLTMSLPAFAQRGRFGRRDERFERAKPAIGETLPDLTVFDGDGKELKLADLRGKHVVLTFGCLT